MKELIKTLKVIDSHDVGKAVSFIEDEDRKNVKEMSFEMSVLYEAILKIFNALRLGTDAFFSYSFEIQNLNKIHKYINL